MVRYTLEVAEPSTVGGGPISLSLHEIDIVKGGQLEESYLCDINPKGQVPALTSPGHFDDVMTESLRMTYWACDRYPQLRPAGHADEINRLLEDVHKIEFFALSFGKRSPLPDLYKYICKSKLLSPDISERYKKALEYKLGLIEAQYIESVTPERTQQEVDRSIVFLKEVDGIRQRYQSGNPDGPWIYGTAKPTALDTTVIVFIIRMLDGGWYKLMPKGLLEMARTAAELPSFKAVYTTLDASKLRR